MNQFIDLDDVLDDGIGEKLSLLGNIKAQVMFEPLWVLIIVALFAIAFGTIWTAYESHVANIGVMAWQREFSQINQPDGQPDNHTAPPVNSAPSTNNHSL